MGCATRELLHLVLASHFDATSSRTCSSPRAGGSSSDRAFARLRPLPSGFFCITIVTADSVEAPLLDTDALVEVLDPEVKSQASPTRSLVGPRS